jgi:hypothetical protein
MLWSAAIRSDGLTGEVLAPSGFRGRFVSILCKIEHILLDVTDLSTEAESIHFVDSPLLLRPFPSFRAPS